MRSERLVDSVLPDPLDAVLLDAGGVLLDLDYAYLRRLIRVNDSEVTEVDLARAEAAARQEINRHVTDGGTVGEAWRDYFHVLLERVGIVMTQRDSIIDSLWEAHQRFGLWTVPIEGGPDTVKTLLRNGHRLGVVSNAEGQVARDLDNAGYRDLFEIVVDSHVVGVEKPDPAIFQIAIEKMKVRPEATIFVGDVPSVDVAGARAAGITPILLDRYELFLDWDVIRLRTTRELADLLGCDGE